MAEEKKMCNNPCDKLKEAVCAHEKGCVSISFFMPCGTTCHVFKEHWEKDRNKEENYLIPDCDTCPQYT